MADRHEKKYDNLKQKEIIQEMKNVANELDEKGLEKEANVITECLQEFVKNAELCDECDAADSPVMIKEKDIPAILEGMRIIFDTLEPEFFEKHKSNFKRILMAHVHGVGKEFKRSEDLWSRVGNKRTVDVLAKIAKTLDERGLYEEADIVDETLKSITAAVKNDYYSPSYDLDKPTRKDDTPTLSVGTCPDHRGLRLLHVGDGVYQCPLDGKVYNWTEGFTALDGTKYRGGRVDLQTPDNTAWTDSPPDRWFEGIGR